MTQLDIAQADILEGFQNGADARLTGELVQHVVRKVADAIIAERGAAPDFDTYAEVKARSNTLALAAADGLERQIAASDSSLDTRLQIAAAGNVIDFRANSKGDLDLEKELSSLTATLFA